MGGWGGMTCRLNPLHALLTPLDNTLHPRVPPRTSATPSPPQCLRDMQLISERAGGLSTTSVDRVFYKVRITLDCEWTAVE